MKKLFSLFAIVFIMVGQIFAQPLPPPPPNTQIPLDVVVFLLILAGIIFGGYKLSKRTQTTDAVKA